MAHLPLMDTDKEYTEQLVKILSTGVELEATKPEGGKREDYPKQPRVPFPSSGV